MKKTRTMKEKNKFYTLYYTTIKSGKIEIFEGFEHTKISHSSGLLLNIG